MPSTLSIFQILIAIQLFYSFAITLIGYSLKNMGVVQTPYQEQYVAENISSYRNISSRLETSISLQKNIPLVDIGALLFYTGNIMIDLFLNFLTAIPSMATILVSFFTTIINLNSVLAVELKVFVWALTLIFYIMIIIQFILAIRTRSWVI